VSTKQIAYRGCLNCPRKFPVTQETRRFCSDACRKEYHRHGGVSYNRIREDLKKDLRPMVEEIARRVVEELRATA